MRSLVTRFLWHEAGSFDRWLSVAAILMATIAGLSVIADRMGWDDSVPYQDARLISVEPEGGNLRVVVGYTKTEQDCDFEKAVAIGIALGEATPLIWEPYRGPNVDAQRTPGRQRLDWTIRTQGKVYDEIEIRTRHDCEGERVDQTMITVEVPE